MQVKEECCLHNSSVTSDTLLDDSQEGDGEFHDSFSTFFSNESTSMDLPARPPSRKCSPFKETPPKYETSRFLWNCRDGNASDLSFPDIKMKVEDHRSGRHTSSFDSLPMLKQRTYIRKFPEAAAGHASFASYFVRGDEPVKPPQRSRSPPTTFS
jgi:hypothetical protein